LKKKEGKAAAKAGKAADKGDDAAPAGAANFIQYSTVPKEILALLNDCESSIVKSGGPYLCGPTPTQKDREAIDKLKPH